MIRLNDIIKTERGYTQKAGSYGTRFRLLEKMVRILEERAGFFHDELIWSTGQFRYWNFQEADSMIRFIIWSFAVVFIGIGVGCGKSREAVGLFTFAKAPICWK